MSSRASGSAVELTVRIRYPLPHLSQDEVDAGIRPADQVEEFVSDARRDPSFLADLMETDRSEVTYDWRIDADDDPWGDQGGEA